MLILFLSEQNIRTELIRTEELITPLERVRVKARGDFPISVSNSDTLGLYGLNLEFLKSTFCSTFMALLISDCDFDSTEHQKPQIRKEEAESSTVVSAEMFPNSTNFSHTFLATVYVTIYSIETINRLYIYIYRFKDVPYQKITFIINNFVYFCHHEVRDLLISSVFLF